MLISASKYADLSGRLQPNLSGGDPTFYGIGPSGERRCLEEQTLYQYENEHDYNTGAIIMRDGTRMATSAILARAQGWEDLAAMMEAKGL